MQREGGGNAPPATGSDSVDFTVDSSHLKRPTRVLKAHKRKKAQQSSDYQAFSSVGVTGFEPAPTRPPELNFTFSNKFNKLYSSGFHTLSKSCSLPLSGVIAISRVPPVFHAPSAYPIAKILRNDLFGQMIGFILSP